MRMGEPTQKLVYLAAVDALAARVFDAIIGRESKDDAVERALAELRRLERATDCEHSWIFRDPAVLFASEHVVEALDTREDGRREWLHAHLGSAVAAVARFDVVAGVVERMALAAEELEGQEQAGTGEA